MAPCPAGVLPATLQQMASAGTTHGGLAAQPQEALPVETLGGLFVAEDGGRLVFVENPFQELSTWSGHQVSQDRGTPGTSP